MHQHYFNELYSQYSEGSIEKEELEGAIYKYYSKNQPKTNIAHWTQDDYDDFISWFYPRLQRAIKSYTKTNGSFETFIKKVFEISSKEYRLRITVNSITEYSAWCVHVPEMYAYEEPPVYSYENKENLFSEFILNKKGKKNPRQLLALILKCYNYVSDDFLEKIAPKLEMKSKELKEMVNKLRKIRQIKDDDLYLLRERIYCQFSRCIVYEKRLTYLNENTPAYTNLKIKLDKARKRLEKMRSRMAQIRTDASNKEVASIIGTSKGSVDASLYRLKTRWNIMSDKNILN